MLLKLNCYMDLSVSHDGENWTLNPAPEDLAVHFRESIDSRSSLFFLVEPGNAVLTFSGDEHWMTLYNSDGDLLSLISELASSEGLFVWKPVWQLNVCWEAEAVAVRPVIYIEKNRRRR